MMSKLYYKMKPIAREGVAASSASMVFFGGLCLILGFVQMRAVKKPETWSGVRAFDMFGLGLTIMVFGGACMVVSFFGFLSYKSRKPWFVIPYMVLSFVVGMVLFLVGIVTMGVGHQIVYRYQDQLCDFVSESAKGAELTAKYNDAV